MLALLPLAFQEGSTAGSLIQFVPLILIFAIFYFILVVPMRKRQKAHQELLRALKKGDRVVTTGGLHGVIAAVQENVVVLKLADNLKVKVSRSAVAGFQGSEELADLKE